MAETEKKETHKTPWQQAEAIAFPAMAAIIGIGYTVAILVNNPVGKVFRSPHALILIAIFIAIAVFPLRSLYKELGKPAAPESAAAPLRDKKE